jgi:hypothetical protein
MYQLSSIAFRAFLCCVAFFGFSCSRQDPAPAQNEAAPASTADSSSQSSQATGLPRPESVRIEQVRVRNGVKYLAVGNSDGIYHLWCNVKSEGCVTPIPGKDYLVFTKTTQWQFPGATKVATLEFFQNFSVKYSNQENIALVPADQSSAAFGVYALNSWESGP